jgi:uncharacterized NAD-dependent epimerase/dehydratase family protein
MSFPEGNAIVYAQGAFGTPNGKTAHGLVRHTERYKVLSVVDSASAGQDAGMALDGIRRGIPIMTTIEDAFRSAAASGERPTHFVMGLAPDGGKLSAAARRDIEAAIKLGLNIDSGLHDFISDDPALMSLAGKRGVVIRDIRKTPPRETLHFFSGKIDDVKSLKIAVLGTDSAVGKRTTAWLLVDALSNAGFSAQIIGTGQTAWMQGAKYSIILDSLINDFISGEIEHAVWSAWHEARPDAIVIEGQGSLLNPAYPGGFEILAAARPDLVVLQHAPARKFYDGFPGYEIQPLSKQIQAIEIISSKPVVAITINHEGLTIPELPGVCASIAKSKGLPAADILIDGADFILNAILPHMRRRRRHRLSPSLAGQP